MAIKKVTEYTGNVADPYGSQSQAEFTQNAFDQFGYLKTFSPDLNSTIGEMNTAITSVEQSEANAAGSASAAEAAASSAGYKGLWPDTGGSALKGETWQTQVGGTPTGFYFVALQNTSVDPVGDNNNWRETSGVTPSSIPNYTDIVYKASGGNSAVENMISGNPITAKIGDICVTGLTRWKRVSVASGNISDFENIGYEFSEDGVTQPQIEQVLSSRYKRALISSPQTIDVSELYIPDRSEIVGFGEEIQLRASAPGKTILNMRSPSGPSTNLSNITLKDFTLSGEFLDDVICLDMVYASVQSMVDGVKIQSIGANSVGVRLSKEWYARTQRCSIRSTKSSGPGGVGVFVDTSDGQINDVPIDFQINSVETGVLVDTAFNYVYKMVLPDTFHAELCDIGLKVKSGYGVRQAVIKGYFEGNSTADVEWGDPIAGQNDTTQNVLWQSVSFNPNNSKIILYEGNHIFDGCDRIDTLEVHRDAFVEIRGGVVNNIVNTTGDNSRVVYKPSVTDFVSDSKYAGAKIRHPKEISNEQITSSGSVVFDATKAFGAKPASGRSATCQASSRRTYESTERVKTFRLTQNAAGTWGITEINSVGGSSFTISVNSSTGEVTLNETLGDTKVYLLRVSPN